MIGKTKYVADFETTTNPDDCRVWGFGVCEVGNVSNFEVGNSIDGFLNFCENNANPIVYFHNLKFDGEFIIDRLFQLGFTHVTDRKELETKTFTTLISNKGQFYSMRIVFERKGKRLKDVTIYDSLKILPFSVAQIAKGFNLPFRKLEMDYNLDRPIGHKITDEEIDYIRHDVIIVAKALNSLFEQGMDKMTQASNALHNYKEIITDKNFKRWFPIPDYDSEVRKSYKGGFTYLNPKYREVDVGEGIVFDVNSLYPSVMRNKPLPRL